MELNLDQNCEIESKGETEFSLPAYMRPLPDEDIIQARESQHSENLIIAIGMDPSDNDVVILTATGKILIFSYKEHQIPIGPIIVVSGGEKVYLPNIGDRWQPDCDGFFIKSEWLIKNSKSALSEASIKMPNY